MKKLKYLLITAFAIVILSPVTVFASGGISVSKTIISLTKGASTTFTITTKNAAGRIDISTANSQVATISLTSDFLDNESRTITLYGVSVGTTTIKVYATDVTTYDDENISGASYIINVTVQEPPKQLSSNNNLKSLSVEGYELVKVDNNNYTLSVSNNITSINIIAEAEDTLATITGTGSHELQIGDNLIELVITSESGAQNKINITINRKDGYYLEDLNKALEESDNVQIIIKNDEVITKEAIQSIITSKKTVSFNYYDENKKLLYSWIIDGTKITNSDALETTISYSSDNKKEIYSLSNYADGLYLTFKQSEDLPKGTELKLYVGDKYEDGNKVKIYYLDKTKNTLVLLEDNLEVKDGYINPNIEQSFDYFITMSTIGLGSNNNTLNNILIIIVILIIISIAIYFIIKIIKKKKGLKNIENNNYEETTN